MYCLLTLFQILRIYFHWNFNELFWILTPWYRLVTWYICYNTSYTIRMPPCVLFPLPGYVYYLSLLSNSFRALWPWYLGPAPQGRGRCSRSGRTTCTRSSCPVGTRLTATPTRTASSIAANTLTIIRSHTHASLTTTALTQVTRPTTNGVRITN